jgi:hypothetical protein
MRNQNVGLTRFYNAFHSPERRDDALVSLRALSEQIDIEVLGAY